mmetsp:Transcript_11977/g.30202  ORF Transcript_11977/g.30202 Transcript_11977/m.30202 type:complete len:202 (-) Transcript_11977:159-764(-)
MSRDALLLDPVHCPPRVTTQHELDAGQVLLNRLSRVLHLLRLSRIRLIHHHHDPAHFLELLNVLLISLLPSVSDKVPHGMHVFHRILLEAIFDVLGYLFDLVPSFFYPLRIDHADRRRWKRSPLGKILRARPTTSSDRCAVLGFEAEDEIDETGLAGPRVADKEDARGIFLEPCGVLLVFALHGVVGHGHFRDAGLVGWHF